MDLVVSRSRHPWAAPSEAKKSSNQEGGKGGGGGEGFKCVHDAAQVNCLSSERVFPVPPRLRRPLHRDRIRRIRRGSFGKPDNVCPRPHTAVILTEGLNLFPPTGKCRDSSSALVAYPLSESTQSDLVTRAYTQVARKCLTAFGGDGSRVLGAAPLRLITGVSPAAFPSTIADASNGMYTPHSSPLHNFPH